MDEFAGKSVLITGAGIGIGYALAAAFAVAGAQVALNDVDPEVAQGAAAQINAILEATRVAAYPADVADVEAMRTLIAEFAAKSGRLDIVCANAGLTNYGRFLDYTPAAFDRLTAVNLRGTYFTAQAAARQMLAQESTAGRIICTSSVTGVQAYPNLSAYGMTKAGISHMVAVLNAELAPQGITVNAISPGAILTERTLADDPQFAANWAEVTPTGRVGQVSDIVATALFLAGAGAAHIGGQTIVVDGGWTKLSPISAATPELPGDSINE